MTSGEIPVTNVKFAVFILVLVSVGAIVFPRAGREKPPKPIQSVNTVEPAESEEFPTKADSA